MSDKTDEEARALLAFPPDTLIDFRYVKGQSATSDLWTIESLQKLARFWLLYDDIIDTVAETLNDLQQRSYSRQSQINYYQDLLDKIKELG